MLINTSNKTFFLSSAAGHVYCFFRPSYSSKKEACGLAKVQIRRQGPFSVPLLLPIFVFGLPFQLRPHSFTSGPNSSPEENLSKKCTFSDDRSFLNTTIIPLTVLTWKKRLISTYLFFSTIKVHFFTIYFHQKQETRWYCLIKGKARDVWHNSANFSNAHNDPYHDVISKKPIFQEQRFISSPHL